MNESDRQADKKRRELIIGGISAIMIIFYLLMNWQELTSGSSLFIFSTVAVFVWLCLVMLYTVYEICHDLKRDMAYNLEDNLVEIRLLKDLNERQLQELHLLVDKLRDTPKKKTKRK